MNDVNELQKLKANILLEEYKLFKQEIWKYVDHWKVSVRYLQVVASAVVVTAGFLLIHPQVLAINNLVMILIVVVVIWVAVIYTSHSILEAEYWMRVISAHMSFIEDELELCLGERVLGWESEFFGNFVPKHKIAPTNMLIVGNIIIFLFFVLLFPALAYFTILQELFKHIDPKSLLYGHVNDMISAFVVIDVVVIALYLQEIRVIYLLVSKQTRAAGKAKLAELKASKRSGLSK